MLYFRPRISDIARCTSRTISGISISTKGRAWRPEHVSRSNHQRPECPLACHNKRAVSVGVRYLVTSVAPSPPAGSPANLRPGGKAPRFARAPRPAGQLSPVRSPRWHCGRGQQARATNSAGSCNSPLPAGRVLCRCARKSSHLAPPHLFKSKLARSNGYNTSMPLMSDWGAAKLTLPVGHWDVPRRSGPRWGLPLVAFLSRHAGADLPGRGWNEIRQSGRHHTGATDPFLFVSFRSVPPKTIPKLCPR